MPWRAVPEQDWHEVADFMGVRRDIEGPGHNAALRLLERMMTEPAQTKDKFTDQELELLNAHILSVEIPGQEAKKLEQKVTRQVRRALSSDLRSGYDRVKVGFLRKWPANWYEDYTSAIEGNCPTVFCGIIQNALAPNGRIWTP